MLGLKKNSFVLKLTLLMLLIIVCIAGILSIVFFYNLYSISYTSAVTSVEKSIENLQGNIVRSLEKYADMLDDTGHAIGILYDPITHNDLHPYFGRIVSRMPEIEMLYFTSNARWNYGNGFLVTSNNWMPEEGWDQTRQAWFINAKEASGSIAFSDPYVDANTGNIIVSISRTVFNAMDRDIGVVAADILLAKLNAKVNDSIVFPRQQLYILNKEGFFITNSEPGRIMKENFFIGTRFDRYRNNVFFSDTFHRKVGSMDFYSAKIPLSEWVLVSITPRSVIFANANRILFSMLIFCFFVFLVTVGTSHFLIHYMLIRPISEMRDVAGALARMDFAVSFQEFRADEIGETQRALIRVRDSLKKTINEINGNLTKVTDGSQQLNKVIIESSQSLVAIVKGVENALSETGTQAASVTQTSDSIAKIVKSIEELEKSVGAQASHITESFSLIRNMVSDINSIRSIVLDISKTAETLSNASVSGNSMMTKLAEEVQCLQGQSAVLQSANRTITDIAAQTTLLSMNAAIEAAYTGASGNGFWVVADQVRKLADMAGKESKDISAEIIKLEEGIVRVNSVTKETVQSMNVIFSNIKSMDGAFIEVNNVVEKQASGGVDILAALKAIQDMTDDVYIGSGYLQEQSNSISSEMKKLQEISENVIKQVNEVSDASRKITSFLDGAKEMKDK